MATDTTVNSLIINKLTKAQYDAIQSKSDTELYLVPDEIDATPISGSDNPVASGGVYTALATKADASSLATVATSGSYNDLSDKPTIPDAQIQSDWNQTTTTAKDYIKNKPTIPTVPTNVSAFTNDAGYLTQHQSLSNYVQKSNTSGLLKNDGTVDTNTYLTSHQSLSGYATEAWVGQQGYLTQHQDISGKADDSSVVHNTGNEIINGTKTLISSAQLKLQGDWNQIYNEDDDEYLGNVLNSKLSTTGTAKKAAAIPWGQLDSTSTATVMTATVPGITALEDGVAVMLKNGVVTSGTNFTLNINNLGAKSVYTNLAAATKESSKFNINYTMLFVYDSTRVSGGGWVLYNGYDSNTNTIGYQLRTNNTAKPMANGCRYYKILFTSVDGTKWVPSSATKTNDAAAAKAVNQTPIDPFGPIVYCANNTNYNDGTSVAASAIWQQYNITIGHSFNWTGAALTLTTGSPVYVKCAPQSNGSAIMDSTTPLVQTLPSTDDGKIYIFLGVASAATTVELWMTHPVYYYKDSAIRLWTNQVAGGSSSITIDSTPTSGSTNAVSSGGVYTALANTGTITGITMNGVSKGTSGVINLGTVITAHQNISGKENTSNKVTSLSSSSTDTQYPSAKCVYDIVGDIQTALTAILGESVSLISFTINGTTYQAENGMTWAEWVASSYNTDGFTIASGASDVSIPANYGGYSYGSVSNSNNQNVAKTDVIVNGTAYTISTATDDF